jgi:hypothetical protein
VTDEENPAESRRVIGFRVKSVTDVGVQLAARLIAIVVEHFDTLITDWFPGLDALTVHGYRLVSRITLCPKCITEVSGVDPDEDQEGDSTGGVPFTQQNDSGAHLTTDGSSTSASPWPSPVHGAMKRDLRIDATPSPDHSKINRSLFLFIYLFILIYRSSYCKYWKRTISEPLQVTAFKEVDVI